MNVLLYADPLRCPELRHEIPAAITDPILYGEHRGDAFVVASQLEADDVRRVRPDAEFVTFEELGLDELVAQDLPLERIEAEIALRACARFGIDRAAVPPAFPLFLADHLRGGGIRLEVDPPRFQARRRIKSPAELDGIRRAARAAETAATAIAATLAAAVPDDDGTLCVDDGPLTSERLRALATEAAGSAGATLDESVLASGPQAASGHDPGSGPIRAGAAIVCDLWPRDRVSGCFADFTRTFVAGADPDEEIVAWHGLCRDALQRVLDATAPGVTGRELWEVACDVFEAAGHATQRTNADGEVLDHGFFHSLGHGVGLEVHEHPYLGRTGSEALVPGDVVAVEPGLYRPGVGGVRLEETVLVTDDGCEVITRFDHELRIRA